jgi:hypothetical protein
MRYLGAVLLVGGFLLCVSIVWAAIGFLMMGFGLICLLVAERKNKRSSEGNRPRQALSPNPEPRAGLVSVTHSSDQRSSVTVSSSYDEVRWNSLVQSDPDLSRLVAVLTPYGQKYVDELATACMALKNKRYLPMILKEIVASARRDAGQDVTNELEVYSTPNASRKTQYVNRTSALQSVYDAVVDDPAVVHLFPKHVTKQSRSPADAQPELPGNRPDGETGNRQKPEREDVQAKILASEATETTRPISLEDADQNSLADLLNSFILNAPSDKTRP